MLLVRWNSAGKVWLAQQLPNFKFNRLDVEGNCHRYGKHWLVHHRYLTKDNEWTQIGPLNMIKWGEK